MNKNNGYKGKEPKYDEEGNCSYILEKDTSWRGGQQI